MAASVPAVASGKTFDLCYCNYDSPGFDPDRHFAFLRGDVSETWLLSVLSRTEGRFDRLSDRKLYPSAYQRKQSIILT